MFELGKKI